MNIGLLTNKPPIGESVAKVASDGGQLVADIVSVGGFFAFCLVFVGFCLMAPPHIYEKYYKIEDEEPTPEVNLDQRNDRSELTA
ncbi:hypothetical protein ACF3MZ_10410 [Paenibacillaceae bacterium WGS1546]|uniref:hypothetical protein n=1 Tax=Cohnella sp. WGS1546 TaxID=3366810 RepID=UPI00372D6492